MKKVLLFLIMALLGCTSSQGNQEAADACVAMCESALENGTDLSQGPCLSNEIATDWVCDVAHSPRQEVDNNQENQCPWFREGKANHFVEVNPSCEVIVVH
jgi:hypothetical protein